MTSEKKTYENKCALIMAGGTGGHVFPALAVAQQLQEQGFLIHWLGTCRGIESRLVPEAGIELHTLSVEGVRGKGLVGLLKAPFLLAKALFQARRFIQQLKPSVVVGFGGFASGPGGLMASLMKVPLVIHEQNAYAGTTNKLLKNRAQRVLQAFDGALDNAQTVGNPVRANIAALSDGDVSVDQKSAQSLNILVLGGSLGARAINQVLAKTLAELVELDLCVLHQSGERLLQETREAYSDAGVAIDGSKIRVEAFIADMASAYDWADLVICRSGALTVSELLAAAKPSVLVPYPFAIDDHQAANAQVIVNANAGYMVRQEALTPQWLSEKIRELHSDSQTLLTLAANARRHAIKDAAQTVAGICLEEVRD